MSPTLDVIQQSTGDPARRTTVAVVGAAWTHIRRLQEEADLLMGTWDGTQAQDRERLLSRLFEAYDAFADVSWFADTVPGLPSEDPVDDLIDEWVNERAWEFERVLRSVEHGLCGLQQAMTEAEVDSD